MILGGTAALLAAFGLLTGLAVKGAEGAPDPVAGAGESPSPTTAAPVQAMPSEPTQPHTSPKPPPLFVTDDKGFVNSNARCKGTQTAAAIGRTQGSFVVVCTGENGQYEYLGVRLSDDAVLRTAAETTPSHGFLARNASVTYTVSPTELLVTAGATVIKHEAMIEFRGSNSAQPATR
jgi:hypothetical protein